MATVNRDENKDITTIAQNEFTSFSIEAEVYVRSKYYPYKIISGKSGRNEKQYITLDKFSTTKSFRLKLDSTFVQTDLSNYGELVFDFSETARGYPDEQD